MADDASLTIAPTPVPGYLEGEALNLNYMVMPDGLICIPCDDPSSISTICELGIPQFYVFGLFSYTTEVEHDGQYNKYKSSAKVYSPGLYKVVNSPIARSITWISETTDTPKSLSRDWPIEATRRWPAGGFV